MLLDTLIGILAIKVRPVNVTYVFPAEIFKQRIAKLFATLIRIYSHNHTDQSRLEILDQGLEIVRGLCSRGYVCATG